MTVTVTFPAVKVSVSALIGTRADGVPAIDRLTLPSSYRLTASELADVSARLVAEYESAELVAPLPARSHVVESMQAVFQAQRDAMRETVGKAYCRATLFPADLPHALDAKV